MRWHARITALLITTTTIAVLLPAPPIEATQSFDWSRGDMVFGEETPVNNPESRCKTQYLVPIGGPQSSRKGAVCVYDHGSWRYGVYQEKTGPDYAPRWNNYFVVGLGVSNYMYKVMNMPSDFLVDLPNSQDIIHDYAVGMFTNNRRMRIMRNFPNRLVPEIGVDETTYMVNDEMWEPVLPDGGSNPVTTKASGISENGRWLALEDGNLGLILKDLVTGELRLFSDYQHRYGVGSDASIKFAISDNGSYVAMFDYNITPTIYSITGNCGLIATDYGELIGQYSRDSFNACPSDEGRLLAALQSRYGTSAYRSVEAYAIEPNGGALYFLNCSWSEEDLQGSCNRLPLYANGYVPQKKLAYLALGDSYSSGEGDTEKIGDSKDKWYRDWTDNKGSKTEPEERCHVSKRSYPYKLAAGMNLSLNNDWQTVACSGAMAWDVKERGSDSYEGQNNRLKGHDAVGQKAIALNEFIPGRAKQIEFVKKHKPSVITLTMGGNDVGFADKIRSCTTLPLTCEVARDDYRSTLKKEILGQFDNLSSLYRELAAASDYKSRIYVLGYPQFISGKENVSCDSILFLRPNERKMIYESVRYINRVIKAAAESSGVVYVDTEGSLGDKKICEGEDLYITAITGIWGYSGNQEQESFHPNAKGNQAIATTVTEKLGTNDLRTYDHCSNGSEGCQDNSIAAGDVEDTDYFAVKPANAIIKNSQLTQEGHQKSGWVSVFLDSLSFSAKTMVGITLHSDPIDLGTFTANADGSLSATVQMPTDVEVGYHRIVVTGKTPFGEDIEYYQYLFVQGSNPEDLNDNGIKDSGETCNFLFPDTEDSDNSGLRRECELAKKELFQSGQKLDTSALSPWSPGASTPTYKRPAGHSNLRESNDPGETILTIDSDSESDTPMDESTHSKVSVAQEDDSARTDIHDTLRWLVCVVATMIVLVILVIVVVVYKFIRRKNENKQ